MLFDPSQVGQLVETIWTVVLGCDVRPAPWPNCTAFEEDVLTGMVGITGSWEGIVALQCSETLARRAASIMFEQEPELLTIDQLEDALCELTNILGGNFKALLPPLCQLGLPSVVKGNSDSQAFAGDRVVTKLAFESSGLVFTVVIISGASLPNASITAAVPTLACGLTAST
jgi:chemotaxis protein CheX